MVNPSLIDAAQLHERGDLNAAVAGYRAILEEDPAQADALRLLGVALMQLEDIDGAAAALNAAIRARPGFVEAMVNIGDLEARRTLLSEALTWYEYAIDNDPAYAPAHFNRALILERLNRTLESIAAFQKALALEPYHLGALTKLASYATQYKDYRALEEASRRITRLTPDAGAGWFMLGGALHSLGRYDEAIAAFTTSLAKDPANVQNRIILAETLERTGRLREALGVLDDVLQLAPQNTDAHHARGNALKGLGLLDESIAAFDEALRRNPRSAALHLNVGIALLQKGDYARGWREYAWNWFHAEPSVLPFAGRKPLWDGSTFQGKRLLVLSDQGNGDYIMAARHIQRARRLGGSVIVESPPGLRALFEDCLDVDAITTFGEARDENAFDLYIPATGLARLFTPSPAAATTRPYLAADEQRCAQWRTRLAPDPAMLNVAIVWKGNPGQVKDHERSTRLEYFAHLNMPGVRFVALQKAGDEPCPAGMRLEYAGERIASFADSAALMSVLDMVISVDSAPAHLAAALGRPTCVLLAFDPHWMYGTSEWATAWYPAMRLFRQKAPGDWPSAFATLRAFLTKMVAEKTNPALP